MRGLLLYVLDLIVPPRPTERLTQTLTLEQLLSLGSEDGLPYHDPRVTALIWEIKYRGNKRCAALAGAYLSDSVLAACTEELGTPLLIPIPMHAKRRKLRGHNHTELLCRVMLPSLQGAAEYAPGALRRTKDTPTQQGLQRAARLTNVAYSMEAAAVVVGRSCIVIDDVTTTGATLAEAKRALRSAGARAVHTIALARS